MMLRTKPLRAAPLLVILATSIGLTPTTSYSNPRQFQLSLTAQTTMNSIGRRIRNVAVDTDVGFDDLFALTMLLGSRDVNIQIITTVQGMTKPDMGADVVRRLLKRFGREDVPVYAGAETPAYGHTIEKSGWGRKYAASYQENIDKLGLPTVEYSGVPPDTTNTAAQALADVCRTNPDTTLLCLGPLTNIHVMSQLLMEQTISTNGSRPHPHTNDMVLMGGAVKCPGNCGPNNESEFNFYSDPRAAHAVFASTSTRNAHRVGWIRLADLDTANDANCDRVNTFIESLVSNVNVETNTRSNDSPALELLPALVSVMPSSSGYDPIATAYYLNPSVMESETVDVTVNDVNGATESSEGSSATTILLATKLNVDLYLQTIQDIMVPKRPVEE